MEPTVLMQHDSQAPIVFNQKSKCSSNRSYQKNKLARTGSTKLLRKLKFMIKKTGKLEEENTYKNTSANGIHWWQLILIRWEEICCSILLPANGWLHFACISGRNARHAFDCAAKFLGRFHLSDWVLLSGDFVTVAAQVVRSCNRLKETKKQVNVKWICYNVRASEEFLSLAKSQKAQNAR